MGIIFNHRLATFSLDVKNICPVNSIFYDQYSDCVRYNGIILSQYVLAVYPGCKLSWLAKHQRTVLLRFVLFPAGIGKLIENMKSWEKLNRRRQISC